MVFYYFPILSVFNDNTENIKIKNFCKLKA